MDISKKTEYTKNAVSAFGLDIDDVRSEMLARYCDMIAEKNKVMNLTRVDSFEDMIPRHIIDSLSVMEAIPFKGNERIMDLGTGAGLPGIPLKIMLGSPEMTLVDSVGKKVSFVNEVIEALGLNKSIALHERAEVLGRDKSHREKYDVCLSRAVADLSSLLEYCLPFVKVGGRFVAYKAYECEEELGNASAALRALGGTVDKIEEYEVGGIRRKLVIIKKVSKTPMQYPRKAGTPSKSPIQAKL